MRQLLVSALVAVCLGVTTSELRAQTRADSAAVLLEAAEQLRLRGETAAARAVLRLIAEQYAGTAAASEVDRVAGLLRRSPEAQRPGRTELLVWSTTYGAWLGIALPLMAESNSEEAYGLGLLAGAPLGFLAAKRYAEVHAPTEGQARAITFGGSWGTYQGVGWLHALDIGARRNEAYRSCPPPGYSEPCHVEYHDDDPSGSAQVTAAVVGGLAGIGTGAWLARKPITAGTAAAVSLSGMWGSWLGWGTSFIAGLEDDNLLTATLLTGNAALLYAGLRAPAWDMSESRARLISIGGVIGGLGGLGLLLLIQPEDEKVAVGIPLVASAAGLAVALNSTRDMDHGGDEALPAGRGALLNLDGGRWALDAPAAGLRLERTRAGVQPAVHVPLLRARF